MPAAKFNIKDALKIVTPMRMEEDPIEYEDGIQYAERVLREGEPKRVRCRYTYILVYLMRCC